MLVGMKQHTASKSDWNVCVPAVRMASSGSTRELALKRTSSASLMSRNGKQWSQFPLGWGHLRFCEFIVMIMRGGVRIFHSPWNIILYIFGLPSRKHTVFYYFQLSTVIPKKYFLIIVLWQLCIMVVFLFEITENNIRYLPVSSFLITVLLV